jgi:hypothetical protein
MTEVLIICLLLVEEYPRIEIEKVHLNVIVTITLSNHLKEVSITDK